MKKNKTYTIEDRCYIAGLSLLAGGMVFLCILQKKQITLTQLGRPCLFHIVTGYYCPGCGGTRAAEALLCGQFIKSFLYHPIVPYAAGLYAVFMAGHTITLLSKKRLSITIKFRPTYLWAALVLVFAQCAVKNLIVYLCR